MIRPYTGMQAHYACVSLVGGKVIHLQNRSQAIKVVVRVVPCLPSKYCNNSEEDNEVNRGFSPTLQKTKKQPGPDGIGTSKRYIGKCLVRL